MSDFSNPYAPPQAELTPELQVQITPDASLGSRFGNLVIDNILRAIIGIALMTLGNAMKAPDLGTFMLVLSYPLYYLLFEGLFGRTPGKFITGTKVVAVGGGRATFGQVLGRTFSRFVPFEPFSFFGGTPTGWHDRWSGTRVVRA